MAKVDFLIADLTLAAEESLKALKILAKLKLRAEEFVSREQCPACERRRLDTNIRVRNYKLRKKRGVK